MHGTYQVVFEVLEQCIKGYDSRLIALNGWTRLIYLEAGHLDSFKDLPSGRSANP